MKSATAQAQEREDGLSTSQVREQTWLVQVTVSRVTGVALRDLFAQTRRPPKVALTRQIAMYLSHVVFEMSQTEVALGFGRDRSTVAYAFRRIEELREDPELDRTLEWLEAMLRRTGRDA
ncbi:MAG: chromosomal replication initiator DnaA [Alphaproteobacteria bacterium]|nr:chromosomal replication initiator DnaA [Alphaproteobacteria bacterium]MDE2495812.1 chromosomal replication initiator DnaA [Alphaproteobacteria bacterium]